MPAKLKKSEHVEFNSRSKWDWDTYFKLEMVKGPKGDFIPCPAGQTPTHGDQWRFNKGEDFENTVDSFRNTVATAARSHLVKVCTCIKYKLDDKGDQVLVDQLDANGAVVKDSNGKAVKVPVAIALVVQAVKPSDEELVAMKQKLAEKKKQAAAPQAA